MSISIDLENTSCVWSSVYFHLFPSMYASIDVKSTLHPSPHMKSTLLPSHDMKSVLLPSHDIDAPSALALI